MLGSELTDCDTMPLHFIILYNLQKKIEKKEKQRGQK